MIFEKDMKFLIFGNSNSIKGRIIVDKCSYSDRVSNSKSFRKLYGKVLKYFSKNEIEILINQ